MMNTFLTIGLIAILTGCTTEPPRYREARAEAYGPPQVQITGLDAENLRLSTVVDQPITHRDKADLLFVTVPVRNTSDRVLHIQYRYNFIDDQGRPLVANLAWNKKTLEPGATERITFNSTTARAADFQLDLRYAR
jgi:uncharacterized protein YcfL